jgi:hypothetical protein
MSSETAATAGGVALLERAVNYALGAVHLVTPAMLDWPTPCRAWDLRSLLVHLDDSMRTLISAVRDGAMRWLPPDDPVRAVRDHACELIGTWTNEPATLEVTVHGWDVARACRATYRIPASLADELLDLAMLLVTDDERPALFDAPVRVSEGAPFSDRLVAYLGRDPD